MKESSSDSGPYIDRIRSWARTHAHGGSKRPDNSTLPLTNPQASSSQHSRNSEKDAGRDGFNGGVSVVDPSNQTEKPPSHNSNADSPAGAASETTGSGTLVDNGEQKKKAPVMRRFYLTSKKIVFHSWINLGLVFVPVGIAIAKVPGMPPGAVFGVNAVAIIPLAGLLSHATESVARKLGDTIGALLNVTFGNAVELIIFIIALVKGEIRIVQASLLGSILANLLLILGMSFFLGGLRFREQIYNSTVTQMSACLLSLSVISLVLPTAFHASWSESHKLEADAESLKISRGTSVILLLVYVMYLLFQLKSHAYMYESTPQHIIDEESTPGPAAAWLDNSSSDSSSSSDSDSDGSNSSNNTVSKRVKRAIRSRRRRKSSVASVDTADVPTRTPSFGTNNASPTHDGSKSGESSNGPGSFFPRMNTEGSEEVIEEEPAKRPSKRHRKYSKRKHHKHRKTSPPLDPDGNAASTPGDNVGVVVPQDLATASHSNGDLITRRVDFADRITNLDGPVDGAPTGTKRPFNNIRGLSFLPVKNLAPPVFAQTPNAQVALVGAAGPVPRVRYGIRRTNSLPDRLNNQYQFRPPGAMLPSQIPPSALSGDVGEAGEVHDDDMSRTAAIIMLLISTALVAICAEFMVDSINEVVATTDLKEIFIGLIILPIVGNAAEHVTAVTVAMKNKMDLAIGVAVGSSIQIALFITPLVVILGWIIDQDMTLYFTLFETVCLFISAFIVNFLVLDGRSNYLEGALLCATYIIIAVVAFFYPQGDDASEWAGNQSTRR
ncbi:Sodium/calcium exchanger protein-domain-containing protein [Pseudomassariella vexata]|uniref:Sodium/calcium exchanger protein-domain-containing protein n=1 Tax=Pseudomassariella vexata TaxID=1141098 RepID=A0A1Y2D9H2_9PEZI|nr:Sodium/calcium exchanger protein-domain-containing protein [Pseudomassariella vexata]ORY55888.1 Sodium/calcium exchanger protein-domain-containing protein [Pseudomassariella vexata]